MRTALWQIIHQRRQKFKSRSTGDEDIQDNRSYTQSQSVRCMCSILQSACYKKTEVHCITRAFCTAKRAFLQWITLYQPWSACILTGTMRRSIRRRRWRMWRIPRRAAASPPTRSCTEVPKSRIRSKPVAAKGPHPKFRKRITVKQITRVSCAARHKSVRLSTDVFKIESIEVEIKI